MGSLLALLTGIPRGFLPDGGLSSGGVVSLDRVKDRFVDSLGAGQDRVNRGLADQVV